MDGEYYTGNNSLEVIDVVNEFNLNFSCGNVLKYMVRAGKKNGETKSQALKKAAFYLLEELMMAISEEQNEADKNHVEKLVEALKKDFCDTYEAQKILNGINYDA